MSKPTIVDGELNGKTTKSGNNVHNEDGRFGYHAGDLGKAEHLDIMRRDWGSTGHFGTGTYFVGDKGKRFIGYGSVYDARPHHQIDFTKYNLYRPKEEDVVALHNFLKAIDIASGFFNDGRKIGLALDSHTNRFDIDQGFYDQYHNQIVDYLNSVHNFWDEPSYIGRKLNYGDNNFSIRDKYEKIGNTLGDDNFRYDYFKNMINIGKELFGRDVSEEINRAIAYDMVQKDKEDTKYLDTPGTVFMKKLGYNGIDVRGYDIGDDTKYGSVIYDLNDEDAPLEYKEKNRKEKETMEKYLNHNYKFDLGATINDYDNLINQVFTKKDGLAYDNDLFLDYDDDDIDLMELMEDVKYGT